MLRIESEISLGNLQKTIVSRFWRHTNLANLIIIRNGKDVVLTREQILAAGFKLTEGDFN